MFLGSGVSYVVLSVTSDWWMEGQTSFGLLQQDTAQIFHP